MSSIHGDDNISLAHTATLASFLSPSLRGDLPAPQTSQVDKGITSSLDSHQQTSCREVKWQEDGVFLTWQDLWVTVSAANNGNRPILQGLTGYAQPGEMLAIMGPSGCGKSTLLDALAGTLVASLLILFSDFKINHVQVFNGLNHCFTCSSGTSLIYHA